jgi:methoxymalonate biosynthesis protein
VTTEGRPTTVKCLVWDLDETLWRGTLAEGDSVRPTEEARRLVAALDRRGILQSIASKNDHDRAWAVLEEFGLAEYFVLPQIGWGPKSAAVRAIADGLNFDLGTIAFLDDRATERAEVTFHQPRVRCYAAEELPLLSGLPEFNPVHVTADSARRRSMYQAGFRRSAAQEQFAGPDEAFLRTLDLRMSISHADESDLARVEELTLRTSQMNATGVHYSLETLRRLCADPRHDVLMATLEDRFGSHGAIGIMLVERAADVWRLKLLATSCRVVSLGAGAAIINWLIDQAAQADVHLLSDFRRTERNRMLEVAYRFSGFSDEVCEECEAGVAASLLSGSVSGVGDIGDVEGLELLHLAPVRRSPPAAIEIDAPDLGRLVADRP